MFEEMRAAVYAARAREQLPDALSAAGALQLATLGSARALGLADEVGSLAAGKRADLAVVSLTGSQYLPWEDPTVAVVFGGSPDRVLLTLVDGESRYEKGGFEWHELRRSAAAARGRMLSEAQPAATSRT
jgi:5-methylthioadenosine/S-adenosylhomocysteine deaminase